MSTKTKILSSPGSLEVRKTLALRTSHGPHGAKKSLSVENELDLLLRTAIDADIVATAVTAHTAHTAASAASGNSAGGTTLVIAPVDGKAGKAVGKGAGKDKSARHAHRHNGEQHDLDMKVVDSIARLLACLLLLLLLLLL